MLQGLVLGARRGGSGGPQRRVPGAVRFTGARNDPCISASGMVAPAEAISGFLRPGLWLCGTLFLNHEGGNPPCWPPAARINSWLSGAPPESGCGAILNGTISRNSGTFTRRNGSNKKEEGGVVGDLRGSMIFRGCPQKSVRKITPRARTHYVGERL